ncbi:MAG: DUF1841 family protein [Pseudomonadota bacterium]|nr:DUF1841 family protein [Pseudomonadota bacterium]
MFSPSPTDVRRFFVEAGRKRGARLPLTPLETIAADWLEAHPEYADDLAGAASRLDALSGSEDGVAEPPTSGDAARENPFLHLSMHLSITEQIGVDQPRGIRAAYTRLVERCGSAHDAQHEIMECLGRMLWDAQRGGLPPDGHAYVDCVRRLAGR